MTEHGDLPRTGLSSRFLSMRTLVEALISAAISAVVSMVVFGPILSRLPSGWAGGDMLSTYVNAENWAGFSYRETTQFGFPLGMNLNYFPGIDITENSFAQLITNITGQPFIGINLLVLLSFPSAAALAYLVIRMTELRGPIAIGLAVAFSVIPYHWGRALGHTYLSTLYSAIIGLALVLLVSSGTFERLATAKERRNRVVLGIVVGAMVLTVAWTGIYYAVFTLILGAGALLWRLSRRASPRALALDALPFAGIGVLALIGFLPAILTLRADSPIASLGDRTPFESVIFAGNLAMALVPLPQTSIPGLGAFNDMVLAAFADAPYGENSAITNHGTWITTAALIVIAAGFIVESRRRAAGLPLPRTEPGRTSITLGQVGFLIGVVVLFFVPWGLNFLFADLLTAQIRGWNRLLPFLLLLFIVGAAVVLRRTSITTRAAIAVPIAVAIIGLSALDSVLPFRGAYRTSAAEAGEINDAALEYAGRVEQALPGDCGVLQLPYMAYPEFGVQRGINDYDHFWTSLTNPGKRWSYGAVKNTDASVWAAQLPQVPDDEQAGFLRQAGFCAIHLDTRGYYAEAVPAIQEDLRTRFGQPIATGFDGAWEFYALGGEQAPPGADLGPAAFAFFHQPMISADEGAAPLLESALGSRWWWTKTGSAAFTITPTTGDVPVAGATGSIGAPPCGPRPVTLTLTSGDQRVTTTVVATPDGQASFDLTLPEPTATPATLTVDVPGDECQVPGAGAQFARVTDLRAIT